MIIDNAIQTFVEKYDREAMDSIDKVSKEYGLNINNHTMKLFNIQETFDTFNEYIEKYAEYMIRNKDNPDASPRDIILESTSKFIRDDTGKSNMFMESNVTYNQLPGFVSAYTEGINKLLKTVDDVKTQMMNESIDQDAIGDVNDICDEFMERMDNIFESAMNNILWASGYNTKKSLSKSDGKKFKETIDDFI